MRQSRIIRNMFIVVCLIACMCVLVSAMSYRPPTAWTQTYTSPQGVVMEPDHGAFYYWWLYHVASSQPQPSYHVHVYEAPRTYVQKYTPAPYQPAPKMKPIEVSTPAPGIRSSGGFSRETTTTSRSSGGFSGWSGGSTSTRSSGSTSRSGGGFSSSSRSSGGRSSGGFSGGGRR